MIPFFPFQDFIECSTSYIITTLSLICHLGTKLACVGKISVGRICLSLRTITLVINLYLTLQRPIYLNWVTRCGLSTLEMNVRKVAFNSSSISMSHKTLSTKSHTVVPLIPSYLISLTYLLNSMNLAKAWWAHNP